MRSGLGFGKALAVAKTRCATKVQFATTSIDGCRAIFVKRRTAFPVVVIRLLSLMVICNSTLTRDNLALDEICAPFITKDRDICCANNPFRHFPIYFPKCLIERIHANSSD